jgi:hypothetical protein
MKQHLVYEEEIKKLKSELANQKKVLTDHYEEKLTECKTDSIHKIERMKEEVDHFNEKYNKHKTKNKEVKEELEKAKYECEKLGHLLENNIQSYERKISELKRSHEQQIEALRKREEEWLKNNEEIMDTDIYSVYREIKKKFEDKLEECMLFKGQNEKILDENKIFKLNLENSENMIKQSAKMQMNQSKLIRSFKAQLEEKNLQIEKLREENKTNLIEMKYKMNTFLEDNEYELRKVKNLLQIKNEENIQLRTLSQIILDQRSEIEQFFIESLEEVKMEIYKKRKEMERKGSYFPNLNKRHQDDFNAANSSKKVDIRECKPEEKEKILRLLFSKINDNYKPKSYKNIDVIKEYLFTFSFQNQKKSLFKK